MSERDITEDQVREEHLAEVRPWLEWAYMAVVVGLGLVAMIVFIAWLGSG